eukprot:scaffold3132_cov119-Isochrysis_galbana.AAC.10
MAASSLAASSASPIASIRSNSDALSDRCTALCDAPPPARSTSPSALPASTSGGGSGSTVLSGEGSRPDDDPFAASSAIACREKSARSRPRSSRAPASRVTSSSNRCTPSIALSNADTRGPSIPTRPTTAAAARDSVAASAAAAPAAASASGCGARGGGRARRRAASASSCDRNIASRSFSSRPSNRPSGEAGRGGGEAGRRVR